jgi:hypothetical protein
MYDSIKTECNPSHTNDGRSPTTKVRIHSEQLTLPLLSIDVKCSLINTVEGRVGQRGLRTLNLINMRLIVLEF